MIHPPPPLYTLDSKLSSSCPGALAYLACDANGIGLPLDPAATGAALYDDFQRCLAAPPRSPQSLSVQAMVARYVLSAPGMGQHESA